MPDDVRHIKTGNGTARLRRLSGEAVNTPWILAVFAHNEAKRIRQALESLAGGGLDQALSVYVLANGCTDGTVAVIGDCASIIDNLYLVESDVADKASTWNLFVHEVLSADQLERASACFFMDGDVTLGPRTLPLLASALDEVPSAEAVGAMPGSGRNRDAWRLRMPRTGTLAGNCYVLRPDFILHLRRRRVRMPVGLIGDDFFVSWLVASNAWREDLHADVERRCLFHTEAEFYFPSLSLRRPADYRTYFRRKWRYTLRGIQHHMLISMIVANGVEAIPADVRELYRKGPTPSRLAGAGGNTLFHLLASQWVRRHKRPPAGKRPAALP